MTIALVAVPAGQAVGPALDDAPGLAELTDGCRSEPVDPVRAPAAMDDRLKTLYARFADLPGFVDVYHVPTGEPTFQATFVGSVPTEAAGRALGSDVGLATLPEEPQPATRDASVSVPSQEDIRCQGIRPGTWADGCTASFVFEDSMGDLYIGSAGHCFDVDQRVRLGAHDDAGTVVFVQDESGFLGGIDFALIDVDDVKEHLVSPEICFWGGPTAGNQDPSILGDPVVANGHGRGVDFPGDDTLVPRPRAGVGLLWGAESFVWSGSMVGGDSGAPVVEKAGEALGTHVRSVRGPDATAIGIRWDVGMKAAEEDLGVDLTLVTNSTVHLDP